MKNIAMRCNKEQFNEIKPILKKNGFNCSRFIELTEYKHLVTFYNNNKKIIGNSNVLENREVYENWDKDVFLAACDIEVETEGVPELWYLVIDKENSQIANDYRKLICEKKWKNKTIRNNWLLLSKHPVDTSFYYSDTESALIEKKLNYTKITTEFFINRILPYCVRRDAKNYKEINAYLETKRFDPCWEPTKEEFDYVYPLKTSTTYYKTINGEDSYDSNFVKLPYELFQKYVLNKKSENMSQKLTVKTTEVLKIHSVACSTWKDKIALFLSRTDKNANITFKQEEVDSMFKAATSDQLPVLERIFGKKQEFIPKGTPCAARDDNSNFWRIVYSDGNGKFSKKDGTNLLPWHYVVDLTKTRIEDLKY